MKRGIKQHIQPVKYRLRQLSRRVFGFPRRSVLFVCTGNTCRSPMAEALAAGMTGWRVASAGTGAGTGQPASLNGIEAISQLTHDRKRVSLDRIRDHESRNIRTLNLWDYDTVVSLNGTRLRETEHPDIRYLPVSDPYGGSVETYVRAAEQLRVIINQLRDE